MYNTHRQPWAYYFMRSVMGFVESAVLVAPRHFDVISQWGFRGARRRCTARTSVLARGERGAWTRMRAAKDDDNASRILCSSVAPYLRRKQPFFYENLVERFSLLSTWELLVESTFNEVNRAKRASEYNDNDNKQQQ